MLSLLLLTAILVTTFSTPRTQNEINSTSASLLAKDGQRWYHNFAASISCSLPDREKIYKLFLSGLLYNFWAKFPSNQIDPVFIGAFNILSECPIYLDRMIATHPGFPMNPFKRLWERGSVDLRQALHPLAERGNWSSKSKRIKLQDTVSGNHETLKQMLYSLTKNKGIPLFSMAISETFESVKNAFYNLSHSNPTMIDVEIHLSVLGLMLDVFKIATKYDSGLENICLDAITSMTKATAPFLKQTHRLIYSVSTKAPELMTAFWMKRESLLIFAERGSLDRQIQRDHAEELMMRLSLETVGRLDFQEIMDIIDLCTIHLFHFSRITRFISEKMPGLTHHFSVRLFGKAMRFAKWVDTAHRSGRVVDKDYLLDMIEHVAEIVTWSGDNYAVRCVEKAVYATYPEMEERLMTELGS